MGRVVRLTAAGAAMLVLASAAAPGASAQTAAALPPVPLPAPAPPPADQNIFYGAVPPLGARSPVIVFVPGLNGTASDWFINNDMHRSVFRNGFRSAYVSLNADNSPNTAGFQENGLVLRTLLPKIASHYGVTKLYLVGHSKGGLDIQAAMLDPRTAALVRAVFTISTPNQGTELADWAFEHPGVAATFNLLTPGVASLRLMSVALFRSVADPILRRTGIPFFTFTGRTAADNPLTIVTGAILRDLARGPNDGVVTVARSKLPPDYAVPLGEVPQNHFATDSGAAAFPKINARIQSLETTLKEFNRIAANGLGNTHSTWAWSLAWFKGRLYVGTGVEVDCMSIATADANGTNLYPITALTGQCPEYNTFLRNLAAEIWEYTPETREWRRVFRSPEVVPVADKDGVIFNTARDIGFRGMTVFTEPDGTQALYAGGVTSGGIFDFQPPYNTIGFPPPRLLRSTDGENWSPVPQTPGTVLGNVGHPLPGSTRKLRSFRALVAYKGKLFATIADYRGVGLVFGSANPAAGNNAWFRASPILEDLPIWNLHVFNNQLYATTGLKELSREGYGVYRTNAEGTAPYTWTPVVTHGGFQSNPLVRSPNGLSFMEFNGQLYVGTNRPTELIRVNPDDTWDLIVGEPRNTPQGFKRPLSGFGVGFGSWFNGHFWRMANHQGQLFLGTWDWSIGAQAFANADAIFGFQYGFDLFRTTDGIRWQAVSQTGLGNPLNYGVRSFASTPLGLFMGTANRDAFEVQFRPDDQPEAALPAPANLESVSEAASGRTVILSWQVSPGASRYRIYRSTVVPISTLLPSSFTLTLPNTDQAYTVEQIMAGELDHLCTAVADTPICETIAHVKSVTTNQQQIGFMLPYTMVGVTTGTVFVEPAPSDLQSIYFVRAEDAAGNLSAPSNIVGGPSKGPLGGLQTAPPTITASVSPAPNANGWHTADQVTVTWTVQTPGAGLKSASGCEPATITQEGVTTLACEATNSSGQITREVVTIQIDRTAPTIAGGRTPLPNAFGWNNTNVEVTFTCADAISGIDTCGETPQILAQAGASQLRSGTATDRAGNAAVTTVIGINLDFTAPVLTASVAPVPNQDGWLRGPAVVTFAATDDLSGIASLTPPVSVGAEGGAIPVVGRAEDRAGNLTTANVALNIDVTPPEAFLRFDPARRDLVAVGVDELSGAAPALLTVLPATPGSSGKRERRLYRVNDRAGNSLEALVFVERSGTQLNADVQSLSYNGGSPTLVPGTLLRFEWATARDGSLRFLQQDLSIGGRSGSSFLARFDAVHNATVVRTRGAEAADEAVRPGLVLMRLATARGAMTVPTE